MMTFIADNLATILISAVLLAVIGWISIDLIRKARRGRAIGCDCGCDSCPNASLCHKY